MADRILAPEQGLAVDARGNLLDMPRDLAHRFSAELLDVVTLLHVSMCEADSTGGGVREDAEGITDATSRTIALIAMADDKVRGILRAISPYV
ncbi:hypothetical protein [Methylibium petroleiphilum]|uniref:hypothetical protein n=1 Tax=Methylibium petroleiphilum TaxID=105560 RepID=UPI003D26BF8D